LNHLLLNESSFFKVIKRRGTFLG